MDNIPKDKLISKAADAFRAVIAGVPREARWTIRELPRTDRAVLEFWAEELVRLVRSEQMADEQAESRAARLDREGI